MRLGSKPSSTPTVVRWRALLLGGVLILPSAYFSVRTPTPTTVSLVYTAVATLSVLATANIAFRRFAPRLALTQAELLTIYAMVNLGTLIGGHDILQVLAPIISHASWYATPENEWQSLFFRHLPRWLTVSDADVLRGYYEPDSTLYTTRVVKSWAAPVFWWSAFLIAWMLAMLCLNALLSRQWTATEKLSYPIIQLPLRLTEEGSSKSLLRSRPLWFGIALAGGINLINGFHDFVPMLPTIPTRSIDLRPFFKEKPLSAMGWTPVCFFPFAVGLSFFMPLSLSFSTWVFFWVWKAEFVFGAAFGLERLPEFPFMQPQASGAWIAIGMFALWNARRHLADVANHLLGRRKLDDTEEPMRYRTAFFGLVAAALFIAGFSWRMGMSSWVVIPFWLIFFVLSVAVVRLRAELGAPVNELYNVGPDNVLMHLFGARNLGAGNMTAFSLFWGVNRAQRCHPMPHQLEGFKMAEQVGMSQRRLAQAMIAATVIGTLASFWAWLDFRYREDFGGGFGWEAFNRLADWMTFVPGPNVPAIIATVVGFGVVAILSGLRYRFLWWPLHPVAYPLASSVNWTASWLWFSIFSSWFVKSLILRQGGLPLYRRSTPFFIGLIIGDFLVGGAFNVYGVLTHTHTYTFWH